MGSATLPLPSGGRRAINPWFVGAAVGVPTLMGVVDTTITGAAHLYIAGSLAVPIADAEWLMTSYLAANAFILPITGWLSAHFGRRNYFLGSIAVFTVASVLCARADNLSQLILFRTIQGVGAGGLQPSTQAILLDGFPPEKQGAAQSMFGFAVLVAPLFGPVLGGWLLVNYDWRWIFYINAPVGVVAFLACYFLLEDPEHLKQERAELKKRPLHFDGVGLGLLALVIAFWELMLCKGEDWDWFGDPFWRVQSLLILFVLALAGFVYREFTVASPVVDLRVFRERNFAASCGITFGAFAMASAAGVALSMLSLTLFGYDASAGDVRWPTGVFATVTLLVVGRLLGWGVDARWLITLGLLVVAAGSFWMTLLNLSISPAQANWPRFVTFVGLSLLFVPLNVAAFLYIPKHLRGTAVGLLVLLRNEGNSFGSSLVQMFQERRSQFHTSPESEFLEFLASVNSEVTSSFAVFWVAAVVSLGLVCLVFLLKRSVAEKPPITK